MGTEEELLLETYFKLKHPDDPAAVASELTVEVEEIHLEQALSQVVPSISIEELRRYEKLRDKYSAASE